MPRPFVLWIVLMVVVVLAMPLLVFAAPKYTTTSYNFRLTSTSTVQRFPFAVLEPGCIIAQVKPWSAATSSRVSANQLNLTVMVSRTIAQTTGPATSIVPLWTSLAVSDSDIIHSQTGAAVPIRSTVAISTARGTVSGMISGTISVEYPPSQTPCEFKARPSAMRGRIDLGWRYTGRLFRGSFLVERSSDGRRWIPVSACTRSIALAQYSCSDTTGLTSLTKYYYRVAAFNSIGAGPYSSCCLAATK